MRKPVFTGIAQQKSRASILIYVLWILVIISALAFQLASSARVMTVTQSASARNFKDKMQLESAIQFARFKIRSNEWNNNKYQLNLNNQLITIDIYNESGFISLYKLRSESLINTFKYAKLSQDVLLNLENKTTRESNNLFINDYLELLQLDGIDKAALNALVPVVSILHDGTTNPFYSPVNVLMLLPGVDQFRVRKLAETNDKEARISLRNEIISQLSNGGLALEEDLSSYYRAHIMFADKNYWVFLKYDRRQKKYKTILAFNALPPE